MSYQFTPDPGPKMSLFSVRIIEAKLAVNVASFGRMHVVAEVRHGPQVFRTKIAERGDQQPRWDEMHVFELAGEPLVHISVFHSAILLLGDTLIGSCVVPLPLASKRKRSGWWDLRSDSQQSVGSVRLSFGFDVNTTAPADSRLMDTICADLEERVRTKKIELENEREELEFLKLKYKRKAEKLNQEKRKYRSKIQTVTEIKPGLTKDDSDLRSLASPRGEDEPGRRQKSMALREELLVLEQRKLEDERRDLDREKAEVARLREETDREEGAVQADKRAVRVDSVGRVDSPNSPKPLRMSLSHDNLPTLDDNTIQQLDEIRQMRITLNQKQEIWEKAMRETETKLKEIGELRKELGKRRNEVGKRGEARVETE